MFCADDHRFKRRKQVRMVYRPLRGHAACVENEELNVSSGLGWGCLPANRPVAVIAAPLPAPMLRLF